MASSRFTTILPARWADTIAWFRKLSDGNGSAIDARSTGGGSGRGAEIARARPDRGRTGELCWTSRPLGRRPTDCFPPRPALRRLELGQGAPPAITAALAVVRDDRGGAGRPRRSVLFLSRRRP